MWSRAARALVDAPLLAPTPDVVRKLRAKHPRASPPDLAALGPLDLSLVPHFTADDVRAAHQHFPRGSAPGPSQLRASHVDGALGTPLARTS